MISKRNIVGKRAGAIFLVGTALAGWSVPASAQTQQPDSLAAQPTTPPTTPEAPPATPAATTTAPATIAPAPAPSATVAPAPQVGIQLGQGFILPFPVSVTIDPRIGGPSAGLMFSLAIYDTLTPGSLTDGGEVAGTGEISAEGKVGPIGGIQQKIAGARDDGAQLFLVPADNCDDAKGARNGDMRLARVDTFETALKAVQTWAADHDAKLPSCA